MAKSAIHVAREAAQDVMDACRVYHELVRHRAGPIEDNVERVLVQALDNAYRECRTAVIFAREKTETEVDA